MGRGARKRRRLQEEADGAAGPSGSTVSNGQDTVVKPAKAAKMTEEPEDTAAAREPAEVFYEPLENLPDDAASLSALLREAAAYVSGGPSCLSDPRRALLLLRHCAPRLPPGQLADRLFPWCVFLAAALRSPRHLWCRDAVCRSAGRLLVAAARLEDAARQLAGGPLLQLVTPLLENTEQATPATLSLLRVILLHFGRGCGTVKNQLSQHLFHLFDSSHQGVSLAACRCVALLPHTGPSGSGGAAYVAAWETQIRGLIRTTHQYLDKLLDGIVEVQTFDAPEESLDVEPPPLEPQLEPIELRYRLSRRVVALCRSVTLMLSSGSQQAVSVPVSAVLELTCRCVAAGSGAVPAALELAAARRCMDDVCTAALSLLETLIVCCGAGLVMRCSLLNRLLLSALQPAAAPLASSAADAARCQALSSLRAWLLAAGAASGLQEDAEKLVTALTDDVRPPQPAKVTIQANAATNGVTPSSGKKKRRPAAEWLGDGTERETLPPAAGPGRARRCQAALEALTQLVTALGPLLKVPVHKSLQSLCVSLLLEVQQQSASPPAPYGAAGCRAGLYRLLRALVADPHPLWPPPTQLAVRLFSHGARDTDVTVSALCQDGQALCTRVVQPIYPSLFFPVDLSAYSSPPAADKNTEDAEVSPEEGDDVQVPSGENASSGWGSEMGNSVAVDARDGRDSPREGTKDTSQVSGDGDGVPSPRPEVPARGRDSAPLGPFRHAEEPASSHAGRSATPPGGSGGPSTPTASSAPRSPAERKPPAWSQPTTSATSGGVTSGPSGMTSGPSGMTSGPSGMTSGPSGMTSGPSGGTSATSGGVTTVTIASSESSGSGDERRSVELADDASIVLGGSDDEPERRGPGSSGDEDEVEILETKRVAGVVGDEHLAPDVAEMLKDFVNEDPEVE